MLGLCSEFGCVTEFFYVLLKDYVLKNTNKYQKNCTQPGLEWTIFLTYVEAVKCIEFLSSKL